MATPSSAPLEYAAALLIQQRFRIWAGRCEWSDVHDLRSSRLFEDGLLELTERQVARRSLALAQSLATSSGPSPPLLQRYAAP